MTYQQTLDWMFAQLPMYQRQGKAAFKKDLTNIVALAEYLGNPQDQFKSIHVGGTNGKGSTSHMLASVLQEAGYKVGLYTSPHLKNFTERIRINGQELSKAAVTDFVASHRDFMEAQGLSFFEMTVGMAFEAFAKAAVDIAIIEVGLGGRLDSTNIITPEVSVITNIGLDHVQMLGDTLEKIAFEKAGIIKPNVPVVIGERQEETTAVFMEKATMCEAPILFASDQGPMDYETDLLGTYQYNNVRTAVTALQTLKGFVISEEVLRVGLKKVVQNTNLKGRWQVLQEAPKVICDTAHNKEGLFYTLKQLKKESYKDLHILLGVVSDKNIDEILPMFPENAHYYFCAPDIPRAMEVEELQARAKKNKIFGKKFSSVAEAYKSLLMNLKEGDIGYVGGSTFVVAEVL